MHEYLINTIKSNLDALLKGWNDERKREFVWDEIKAQIDELGREI